MLISEEEMVDLSPATDCLGRVESDESETARTWSHLIRALLTGEPSKGKESSGDIDNCLRRFWETQKPGTDHDGRLVLTEEDYL